MLRSGIIHCIFIENTQRGIEFFIILDDASSLRSISIISFLPYRYRFHRVIEMVDKLFPKELRENKRLISIVLHRIMKRDFVDLV